MIPIKKVYYSFIGNSVIDLRISMEIRRHPGEKKDASKDSDFRRSGDQCIKESV